MLGKITLQNHQKLLKQSPQSYLSNQKFENINGSIPHKERVDDKKIQKIFVIIFTNTLIEPYTVVIECGDTDIT